MPSDLNLTEAQQRRLLQVVSGACYLLIACYAFFILYLVSGFWAIPGWFYRTGIPAGADFLQVWAASKLALGGHPAWAYNPAILKTAETAIVGGAFAGYLPWRTTRRLFCSWPCPPHSPPIWPRWRSGCSCP